MRVVFCCGARYIVGVQTTTRAKRQRLEKGWTLRELGQRCAEAGVPIDYGQLGRIERGEAVPRPELRAVLAQLLDLDVINDFYRKAS